jgi:hypothetical protein
MSLNRYTDYVIRFNQIKLKHFSKIEELLAVPNVKKEWQARRQKMLSKKIDYTQFLIWFIENYPESRKIMQENPDYQWKFK